MQLGTGDEFEPKNQQKTKANLKIDLKITDLAKHFYFYFAKVL
jgi:hypothetical protein